MDEPDFIGKMGTLEDRPVADGPGRPARLVASIDVLAIKRWERVKPQAVMAGSRAQGENVLTDAIKDILAMCDVISRMRGEGYQLEVANRALRAALAQAKHQATMEERARCAAIARNGCLVPPDGGSPTEAEAALCDSIAAAILKDKSQ